MFGICTSKFWRMMFDKVTITELTVFSFRRMVFGLSMPMRESTTSTPCRRVRHLMPYFVFLIDSISIHKLISDSHNSWHFNTLTITIRFLFLFISVKWISCFMVLFLGFFDRIAPAYDQSLISTPLKRGLISVDLILFPFLCLVFDLIFEFFEA